ncbi:MAG: RND transporter, partial [Candidatus Electrothrix sp. ATG2]|nr:RND transporter [Candidatus Electrothrix sp. ATG2]
LGFSPFIPEPHLFEKIRMLVSGTLARPIDIFDLFFHAVPLLVLFLKLIRLINRGPADKE